MLEFTMENNQLEIRVNGKCFDNEIEGSIQVQIDLENIIPENKLEIIREIFMEIINNGIWISLNRVQSADTQEHMNQIKEQVLQKLEDYNFCGNIQIFQLFGTYTDTDYVDIYYYSINGLVSTEKLLKYLEVKN